MKPSERINEIRKTKTYFNGNQMLQDESGYASFESLIDYLDEEYEKAHYIYPADTVTIIKNEKK